MKITREGSPRYQDAVVDPHLNIWFGRYVRLRDLDKIREIPLRS